MRCVCMCVLMCDASITYSGLCMRVCHSVRY